MNSVYGQFLCVVLCTVMFGTAISDSNTSALMPSSMLHSATVHHSFPSTLHPSPSIHVLPHNGSHNTSIHSQSSSIHSISKNISSHNHTTSSILSTIHHNATTVVHTSIMPSPSANHSISINMTAATQNASHMSYTVVPTHSISPSNTSTVVPPSSSMAPTTTPPPKLPKGKFSVQKGNNESCLLFWLSLEFIVKYKNKSGEEITRTIIMPNSSHPSGQCQSDLSSIRITWGFYYVEVYFKTMKTAKRDSSEVHWTTTNLTISVQVTNNTAFGDAASNITEIIETESIPAKLEWLSGANGHSLNCSQDTVKLGSSITATFENMRIQPFGVERNGFSDKVDVCNPPPTPKPTEAPTKKKSGSNTVAIAVGCSLGGLVLIVLIGYFITQRRKNSIRYRKL